MAAYRIGIDVGGTFTHAVALEANRAVIIAQTKVPTTHRAPRGVSEGVIQALREIMTSADISPDEVNFLAYSTTQVTNALLEGDVAPVGIIAIGGGLEGRRVAHETRIGDLKLAPGKFLPTHHRYLELNKFDEHLLCQTIEELRQAGAEAIVAAEAFSVDDPSREQYIMAQADKAGLPSTGTHEITGRYGLRMRTRTAVINASLLPKAISTADMTEMAAQEIGIKTSLMVVRSDGGVMSIQDMRRRPLLTLLSGPAAGVAAALLYARVSEGVFIEVGGTSSDICAIRHGRALLRTAEVGGQKLFLRTLDVRTLGVAGGSLPRLHEGKITAVGPRSAHLAGLPYICFSKPEDLSKGAAAALISPQPGDPQDYAIITTDLGRYAITVTCAANALDLVPKGDFAKGDSALAQAAFAALGELLSLEPLEAAEAMLVKASEQPVDVITNLLAQRGLDHQNLELIGGGGGAGALVPFLGQKLGLSVRLAENAPVISAIGTALALVREVIEHTVPDAGEEDVLRIRQEAVEAVIRQGADPDSVSVDVEYDARSALLRATASGQTELREHELAKTTTDEERRAAASKGLNVPLDQVELAADTGLLHAYYGVKEERTLFGLLKKKQRFTIVVDQQGIVRLILKGGMASQFPATQAKEALIQVLDSSIRYGDAGAELPQLFLGIRGRIVNLSGLISIGQILSLVEAELVGLTQRELILIVTAPQGA